MTTIQLPFNIIDYIFEFIQQDKNSFVYKYYKKIDKIFYIPNPKILYYENKRKLFIEYLWITAKNVRLTP